VVLDDIAAGMALAVGVLPAAIVGLAPKRRGRLAVVALGVLTGIPIVLGGILTGIPVLAVATIGLLGIATALLAARSRIGAIAMTLSLPMVGVGLSFTDVGEAAALAGLIVAGSIFACLVSLPLPERPSPARPAPGQRPAPPTLGYGIRLGAAGATAAAIGYLLDLEHVGWACAAALLVMRPVAEMQRIRSAGRILAVTGGALVAIGLVRLDVPAAVYGLAALAAVAGAAGLHRSRWYVTSAFTTFLAFVLLLYSHPEEAGSRFGERVGETLLGVGLAYLFGLALPAVLARAPRAR
jgi:Fusaric acid resistance protein-like